MATARQRVKTLPDFCLGQAVTSPTTGKPKEASTAFVSCSFMAGFRTALARQTGYLYPLRQRTGQKTSSHSEQP